VRGNALVWTACSVLALGACQHRAAVRPAAVDSSRPIAGMITRTNGQIIQIEDDNMRRAEILISPATEIVMRNGSLGRAELLRPGRRVTVWMTDGASGSDGVVRATAQRVMVDP
jgi:hypothetical protein